MMIFKMVGVALVLVGCGGVGFSMANQHKQQEEFLRQLIGILDYMSCELQYRFTPLPNLCRQAASECKGGLQKLFLELTQRLEDQLEPDVDGCMKLALRSVPSIPSNTRESLELLGRSLGRFDMEGQLKGLESVRQECRRRLTALSGNRESRLRCYQTLGLCAGAALAILFI